MGLLFVIGCLLLMVTRITSQNGSFNFNNVITVHFTNNSQPVYYDDWYVAVVDKLQYSMVAVTNGTVTQVLELQVFRQTGADIGSRKMICIIDIHGDNCSSSVCSWKKISVRKNYQLQLNVVVTQDLNNTALVMQLRKEGGTWFIFTPVIRVHALPVFTVKFNDTYFNINNCTYQVTVGQNFSVEFCTEFLKSPSLEVSLHGSPTDPVSGRCAVQNFSVSADTSYLHLIYRDGCRRAGSFTCVISAHNTTTTKPIDVPVAPTSSLLSWSTIFVMVTVVLLFIIAGLGYLVYRCNLSNQKGLRKKKKDEYHDETIANAIFEVFTGFSSEETSTQINTGVTATTTYSATTTTS